MNDVLKQRLVGAIVIIVLGVIAWPIVFSDPSQMQLDRTSQVPKIPSLQKMQLEAPEPVENVPPAGGRYDEALAAEAEELERLAQEAEKQAEKSVPEQLALPENGPDETTGEFAAPAAPPTQMDERGIPMAWVLQIVTVSKKSKAEELVRELVEKGHKAYFRPIQAGDSTLYRVNLGPRFERKAIEELKPQIDRSLRVQSIVARYVP